jgi:hypothetical protein
MTLTMTKFVNKVAGHHMFCMYIHEQISAFSTGLSACSMSQGIGCFNMEGPTIINSNGD